MFAEAWVSWWSQAYEHDAEQIQEEPPLPQELLRTVHGHVWRAPKGQEVKRRVFLIEEIFLNLVCGREIVVNWIKRFWFQVLKYFAWLPSNVPD